MAIFPQLATGATAHFPAVKYSVSRTVANAMGDGRRLRWADAGAGATEWQLSYSELSDGERTALEDFFNAMEGRLKSFTFLDPLGNLLAWSEDFGQAVWEKGPLVSIDGGITDPAGGQHATRVANPSGAAQTLLQTVEAPTAYMYTLSIYARADEACPLTLLCGEVQAAYMVGTEWGRFTISGQGAGSGETTGFGIEVPAGRGVDVFGMQAEAQPAASGYRPTAGQAGVYRGTRFKDDALYFTAESVGRHSCRVNIIHANHL